MLITTVLGSFCNGVIKSNAGTFTPTNPNSWADNYGYWTLRFSDPDKSPAIIQFVKP